MDLPLVTVICTCYNHEKFIHESLDSVLFQSYPRIEMIIIDNGSKDQSLQKIRLWLDSNKNKLPCTTFFYHQTINYCQSFNKALGSAKGDFTIDLSGDDILLVDHVSKAVETLEQKKRPVYFSNAYLKNEQTGMVKTFYPIDKKGRMTSTIDSGDIYALVVKRNYLCAATMVFRTEVLLSEGGYDENLSYEDFDIIVRLARKYSFVFNEYPGVIKRILKNSFAAKQYRIKNSPMLPSTLRVCIKIQKMNRTKAENSALQHRVMYETKHALASSNFDVVPGLLDLAKGIGVNGAVYELFRVWEKHRWDLSRMYKWVKS
jgi:glycosyltransferase involved in cell wall biosynthesis